MYKTVPHAFRGLPGSRGENSRSSPFGFGRLVCHSYSMYKPSIMLLEGSQQAASHHSVPMSNPGVLLRCCPGYNSRSAYVSRLADKCLRAVITVQCCLLKRKKGFRYKTPRVISPSRLERSNALP